MTDTRSVAKMRSELEDLRARYDGGAVSPGIWAVIQGMEREIAWEQYRIQQAGGPRQ